VSRTNGESMGRVKVEVDLVNHADAICVQRGILAAEQVRRLRVKGTVDTGSTFLVVPETVADQLGVPRAGQIRVTCADRRKAARPVVEDVPVELLGRHGTFKAIVEPRREDVLIGAIVLEDLDLLVDCRTQTLHPRDPTEMTAEIE
jgi:clan AA aspartic protease